MTRCLKCGYRLDWLKYSVCPNCRVVLTSLLQGTGVLSPNTLLKNEEYLLEGPLGHGGFGITYQARHQKLGKVVAIKEFFPRTLAVRDMHSKQVTVLHNNEEVCQRAREHFMSEGAILAKINHPNVVRAVDLFEEYNTVYLVMDFIEGHTFEHELEKPRRPLSEARVREVLTQLVAALEAAHKLTIFHLDLKPENVMVTTGGRIVLVDFGAARQDVAHSTNYAFFTKKYAPLEVALGGKVGAYSDLFELGMMLYEMLRGDLPPSAEERQQHGDRLDLAGFAEPWKSLLSNALQLEKEKRADNINLWWSYEEQHRAYSDRRQRQREEQTKQQEKDDVLQETRRLRAECEKLSGIVGELRFKESQSLIQNQNMDKEIEFLNSLLNSQAERLETLERYASLITILEGGKEVAQIAWGLYLKLIKAILKSLASKGWLIKPHDVSKDFARRVGLVVIFFLAIFLTIWIINRQR